MTHTPVVSSNLQSVGYEAGVLEVRFKKNPHTYRYSATEEEYKALLNAPSKGKHFAAHFKTRAFEKIKPEDQK